MTRPLELTVYPRADEHTDHQGRSWFWSCQACSGLPDEYFTHNKHLTDAELAAEAWYSVAREAEAELRGMLVSNYVAVKQTQILHRFATLPHYDEDGE